MHAEQVERYGRSQGIRDAGLLEGAFYHPQTGYYADLIEEAAALWESLAQNHPLTMATNGRLLPLPGSFLAIKGTHLAVDSEAVYVFNLAWINRVSSNLITSYIGCAAT